MGRSEEDVEKVDEGKTQKVTRHEDEEERKRKRRKGSKRRQRERVQTREKINRNGWK